MYGQFANYVLEVESLLKAEQNCQHFTEEIAIDLLRILYTRTKETLKRGYIPSRLRSTETKNNKLRNGNINDEEKAYRN